MSGENDHSVQGGDWRSGSPRSAETARSAPSPASWGLFQQNVNRYERGATPHPNFLLKLALQEGISIDWLLLGVGNMKRRGG